MKIESELEKMKGYNAKFSLVGKAINKVIKNIPKNIEMREVLQRIKKFNEQIADCKDIAYYYENICSAEQLTELEERLNACNQCLVELWRALPIRNKARYRSIPLISKWFKNPQNQILLDRVTILTLTSRDIAILPIEFLQLHNLQYLDLSVNRIVSLPEWMNRLTALKTLNLSHNKLEKIPEWIGRYTTLRKLDLSYNKLEKLPTGISQCAALERVNVSNNQIKEFPKELLCLRQLIELNISMNQITSIFKVVSELTVLRTVRLTY
jgi:Leucine-rich repeat (LRR) protein